MINVLLTGDSYIFRGLALNILSALKYTKAPIMFHVMTINVPWNRNAPLKEEDIEALRKMIKDYDPESDIRLYDVSSDFIEAFEASPNKHPAYSPASLVRLFLSQEIECDKLIYLDCDTMVCSSLEAFNEIDIDDYEIAVCLDYMGHRWIFKDYFNSGVIYINMKKVKETHLFENCIELLKKKKFYFADQTAIYKCSKYRKYIPWRFNEQRNIKEDTVIKHFNKGIKKFPFYVYNIKQWEVKKVYKFLKIHYFDDIYEEYDKYFKDSHPLDY